MPSEFQQRAEAVVLPLNLLTGFLGAGKTTLLNRLLHDPGMVRTAVIINEFGEIGLDHLLVESSNDTILEMSSGCLCCTIRGELVDTLISLLARRDAGEIMAFDRVIIETTGLADPAPVLHVVMSHPVLVHRLRLDGVVTLVDAVNGATTLDAHEEAIKQVAVADRLVLTKTDIANANGIAALRERLKRLNPAAPVLIAGPNGPSPAELFGAGLYDPASKSADVARWLAEEAYAEAGHDHSHHHHEHGDDHGGDHLDPNRHGDRIQAYCVSTDHPIGELSLSLFLELLNAQFGPNLLRMKGIVKLSEVPERPMVVHGVQGILHPPALLEKWPDDNERTRLVFITREVDRAQIEELLKAFTDPLTGSGANFADKTLSLDRSGGLLT